MTQNDTKIKNKKNIFKNSAILAFVALISAGIIGIGFGVANFVKYGSKNRGNGYENTLQTQLQYAIPNQNINGQNLSDQETLLEAEKIANKVALISEKYGISEVQIQSGIQKESTSNTNKKITTIANVYLHTDKSLFSYDFNFDLNPTESETTEQLQAKLDSLKLTAYYRLANNYSYYLQDISNLFNNNISEQNKNTNFENQIYKINSVNSEQNKNVGKAYVENNKLLVGLRPNTIGAGNADKKTWDLSVFQKQFTEVYGWDGDNKTTRQEWIDQTESNTESSITLVKPNISYLFYRNRNGLITLLQNLTTITALKDKSNLNTADYKRANELYDSISKNSEYKAFMDWTENKEINGGLQWTDIMSTLFNAQKQDFSIDSTTKKDPLLDLLNSYYTSSIYKNTHDLDKVYKDYEFLYSWNFKKDSFISQYLTVIDYYNWFNFFVQDATKEQLENKDYVKETYLSQKIDTNWAIYDYSLGFINSVAYLLNNASIDTPFINYALTSVINQSQGQQVQKLFDAYYSTFLDRVITEVPGTEVNSITNLDPFVGAMIGLTSIILLIGIIVSVLYRIPGLIITFGAMVSYALTLLMFTSLGIVFSVSSVFSIATGIILMFIPFFYAIKEFKNSFRNKNLNLNNSFKKSILAFIKSSLIIHISFLIIGLTFLFLGNHQIQNFGAAATLIGLSNFISCFVLVLFMLSLLYFLILKNYPQLMFGKKDIQILNKLRKNRIEFDDKLEPITNNNNIDKWSLKLTNKLMSLNLYTYLTLGFLLLIGIVGVILLTTLGPANSLYFKYSNQILLTFSTTSDNVTSQLQNANKVADTLQQLLKINFIERITYLNIYPGYSQLLLIPNVALNASDVYKLLNTVYPEWIPNMQVLSINTYFSFALTRNSIDTMFITLGFLAIFNIFMFNIINVFPMFLISLANILVSFGFIGIVRIPINLNTASAFISGFIIMQMIIIYCFMSMKLNFDLKQRFTFKEFINFSFAEVKKSLLIIIGIIGIYWLAAILMIIFESYSNILNYVIMMGIVVLGALVTVLSSPILFSCFMMIRESYLSKVQINKSNKKESKQIVYDKVDEQIIPGINHS